MGLAMVILTIGIRVLFLPLSIIDEIRKAKLHVLSKKIERLEKDYGKDVVAFREHTRQLLKKYKVTPWAAMALLAIQALVLVVLYQVMNKGIKSVDPSLLYSWVEVSGTIDTTFLGVFDTAARNFYTSFGVGVILFVRILQEQVPRRKLLTTRDFLYRYLFPLATFVFLFALPSIKTVFILTSIIFSGIIHSIQSIVIKDGSKNAPSVEAPAPDPKAHLPKVRDRFTS